MGKLYFEDKETGEIKALNAAQNFELECESIIDSFCKAFEHIGYTTTCSIDFKVKMYKRKRFIKLLMGRGFSKNEAIKIAKKTWNKNKSYSHFDFLGAIFMRY